MKLRLLPASAFKVGQIDVVFAADKERESVNELRVLIQIIQLLSY